MSVTPAVLLLRSIDPIVDAAQDYYYYYYLYMRAMGRHGFPGIPRRHAAAFSCNGSARGICADAYI